MIVERIYFGRLSALVLARLIALVFFRARLGAPSSKLLAEHIRGKRMTIRKAPVLH